MITRKAKLAHKIDSEIVSVLKSSKNPVSTRDLALRVNRAWHSVQAHCLKLQIKGEVNGFNISNINVWEIKKHEQQ